MARHNNAVKGYWQKMYLETPYSVVIGNYWKMENQIRRNYIRMCKIEGSRTKNNTYLLQYLKDMTRYDAYLVTLQQSVSKS